MKQKNILTQIILVVSVLLITIVFVFSYFSATKKNNQDIYKDMYIDHYHSTEIWNNNVYIIKRVDYDGISNNWTDELWRYNNKNQGKRLFSKKGLDFRVAPNELYIALNDNNSLFILNKAGNIIKTYTKQEIFTAQDATLFQLEQWDNNNLWIKTQWGPALLGLTIINATDFNIKKYSLENLSVGFDYSLNANKRLLAYSDYPTMFDVDSRQEFEAAKIPVNFFLYNLESKEKQLVATSIGEKFTPIWLNETTLEYSDPANKERISKQF